MNREPRSIVTWELGNQGKSGTRCLHTCLHTSLRVNGTGYQIADDFPFVLSLSRPANYFFNSLARPDPRSGVYGPWESIYAGRTAG